MFISERRRGTITTIHLRPVRALLRALACAALGVALLAGAGHNFVPALHGRLADRGAVILALALGVGLIWLAFAQARPAVRSMARAVRMFLRA